MSPPPVSSAATLALLRNAGPDGIDPIGFQADRLVLQHRVVGGVDADALARALAQSQAFRSGQAEPLLQAVQARMGAADRRNLAEALATTGAASGPGAQLDRAAYQLGAGARAAIGRISDAIGDNLAEQRHTLQQAADDPSRPEWLRTAADVGSRVLGKAQEQHGIQVGGIRQAVHTVRGVVNTVALAERFVTDADFRQLLLSTARLYAEQTIDDPSKPYRDLRKAAVGALQGWAEGLQQAERAGRRDQYLGETTGAIAFDAALAAIPLAKLSRLGRMAEALDRATPDGMAAAAELAEDAGKPCNGAAPRRVSPMPCWKIWWSCSASAAAACTSSCRPRRPPGSWTTCCARAACTRRK